MVLARSASAASDITQVTGEPLRKLRRQMQLVFQDPYASLNPRKNVLELVAEPLIVHGAGQGRRGRAPEVETLLDRCGLPARHRRPLPARVQWRPAPAVGIARALALRPDFIVADEPVSALDVSVRAQVVNLLQDLQEELGLTYLFIAHDLSVVRHISHRIAILYCRQAGRARADRGSCTSSRSIRTPRRCCRACRSPIRPRSGQRRRIVLTGEIPNPVDPPPGCRFQTRCPLVQDVCRVESPPLKEKVPGHWAALLLPLIAGAELVSDRNLESAPVRGQRH